MGNFVSHATNNAQNKVMIATLAGGTIAIAAREANNQTRQRQQINPARIQQLQNLQARQYLPLNLTPTPLTETPRTPAISERGRQFGVDLESSSGANSPFVGNPEDPMAPENRRAVRERFERLQNQLRCEAERERNAQPPSAN